MMGIVVGVSLFVTINVVIVVSGIRVMLVISTTIMIAITSIKVLF